MMFDPILLAAIGALLTCGVILRNRLKNLEDRIEKLEKKADHKF